MQFVNTEMKAYRLYTVVPRLLRFMEDLTNWYVKMNRSRLKGAKGANEAQLSIRVLFQVLMTLVRSMAPFTPMFCELLYLNLRHMLPPAQRADSVHFLDFPQANLEALDERMELKVARMQALIEKGRAARDKRGISLRTPVRAVTVICPDGELLKDLDQLQGYIKDELNIRAVNTTTEEGGNLTRSAAPDNTILGKRLGKDFRPVGQAIKVLTNEQLIEYESKGQLEVAGHMLSGDDLRVTRTFTGDTENIEPMSYDQVLALFDVGLDEALRQEGTAREIVSRVQQLRKKAALSPENFVEVYYTCEDAGLKEVLKNHMDTIKETTRVELVPEAQMPARLRAKLIIENEEEVNGAKIKLTLTPAVFHVSSEAASSGKTVEELSAALDAVDLKDARAALAAGKISVAGVELAADSQVFFTLGALLAANKTPL